MKAPASQTRILASAPVFFGSWGFGIWSLYQLSQHDGAWPIVVAAGLSVAAVMKADAEVKAHANWVRDWDAMAGAPPPHRSVRHTIEFIVGVLIALPLISLLLYAGQHGGSQAVTGVFLVLGGPILGLAGLVQLWRWVRRGRAKRTGWVQPVTIAIKHPLLPVPSLKGAYQTLPPYCQQLLRGQP